MVPWMCTSSWKLLGPRWQQHRRMPGNQPVTIGRCARNEHGFLRRCSWWREQFCAGSDASAINVVTTELRDTLDLCAQAPTLRLKPSLFEFQPKQLCATISTKLCVVNALTAPRSEGKGSDSRVHVYHVVHCGAQDTEPHIQHERAAQLPDTGGRARAHGNGAGGRAAAHPPGLPSCLQVRTGWHDRLV